MIQVQAHRPTLARTGLPFEPSRRPTQPATVFAVLGAGFLLLVAVSWTSWILSDDFTASPGGADEFSGGKLVALRIAEAISLTVAIFLVWRFLVRPLVREGRLTFDGMLVLVAGTMWWWDPVVNYMNFQFAYNTHFFDMASWTFQIPGWSYPNANTFPEPIFMIGGTYLWWICGFSMAGCAVVRRLERTRPQMSYLKIFGVVLLVMAAMDAALEITVIRMELWAYPGVVGDLALFSGSRYQFPLYESAAIGVWCTGLTALRHFRDDRGFSYAERGVAEMGLSTKRRRWVPFLAVAGLMHLWYGLSVFVPLNYFGLKVDTFAPTPSYLRAGVCGEGTEVACPGAEVPVPHRGSIAVTPDDPCLSPEARESQGLGIVVDEDDSEVSCP